MRSPQKTLLITALVALASLSTLACDDGVEVSNLPGHVAFVGPSLASEGGVATVFGVSDPEGDLLKATFEVCDASGAACAPPARILPGSTSLGAIPTFDPERVPALQVRWLDCARLQSGAPLTIRIGIEGSDVDPVLSPPITPDQLGVNLPAICP